MSENIAKYNVLLELIADTKGIEKTKQSVGGLEKTFNTARTAFAGIITGAAVQQQLTKIFDITKKYQQYNTILKVATGSQQEATKSLQLIENAASETVFSVDELTSSYIKFANRGVKPTKDEIIALADLAASQGKSFDQLTEATLDAMSSETERLKEFGIRAKKEGNNITLSFKGVNKTIENTPEAIRKAIISFGKLEGVAGSNAKQMKDLSGVISNIGDNTEKVYKNLGERLKGFFTESLGALASFVEKLVEFTEIPVSEKLQEEQISLNVLVQSITDTNVSQEKRNSLIAQLQEEYPFFLKNINAETASNDELKARLREVNELYIKRIALQGQTEKIEKALKVSGESKSKQLEIERKRRTDLNKIVAEYKLPVDLNAIDGLDKQTSAVLDNLKKLFSFRTSERTGENIINGNRQAYDSYQKLVGGFINASGAAKNYEKSLKEVEEQQNVLKDFEKSLGGDLEYFNKLFDVAPEPKKTDDTTKGSPKGKQEDPVKKVKEDEQKRLDQNIAFAEKNFALREKAARETIKDEKLLAYELEKIEKEKNIAILRIKQDYAGKDAQGKTTPLTDEGEFIKLGNLIDEAIRDYDKFEASIRKIDIIDILPDRTKDIVIKNAKGIENALVSLSAQILATADPNVKAKLEKQFNDIAASIKTIGSKKLNKLTFETGGFEAIDLNQLLPNDRIPALQNRLGLVVGAVDIMKDKLKAGLGDPLDLEAFDSLRDEGEKIIELLQRLGIEVPAMAEKIIKGTGDVLGLSPETLQLINQSIDVARDAFTTISDIYIAELDRRIEAQQSRVEDAEKIAEKGNVKQLELEEERLAKLEDQRTAAAERAAVLQKAAAQAQIIINTALTISNIQAGASRVFLETGVAAPVTVPIVLAIVGGLIASAANLFSPPAFIEGVEEVQSDHRFKKYKQHSGRDGYIARFDGRERIVDPITNMAMDGFPNALLPDAVKLYMLQSKAVPGIVAISGKGNDAAMLDKLDNLKESIEAIKIDVRLDEKGFLTKIEKMLQGRVDRKRYTA